MALTLEGWLANVVSSPPDAAFITEVISTLRGKGITTHEQLDGLTAAQIADISAQKAVPVATFITRAAALAAAVGDAKRRKVTASPPRAAPPPTAPQAPAADMSILSLLGDATSSYEVAKSLATGAPVVSARRDTSPSARSSAPSTSRARHAERCGIFLLRLDLERGVRRLPSHCHGRDHYIDSQ